MEQEDKVDKQMYRELLKQQNRNKKMKLKPEKQSKGTVELSTEEENNEVTNYYIDTLPDPNKVYANNGE